MFDCTTPEYDALYAPWLKDPGKLLRLVHYDPTQDTLLDLCGGTGAVACHALVCRAEATGRGYAGPAVVLLDKSPRVDDHTFGKYIMSVPFDVNKLWPSVKKPLDVIVCRQALGYVQDLGAFFYQVAHRLHPRGRFVFNTFENAPRWQMRKHEDTSGRPYRGFSLMVGRWIGHLQMTKAWDHRFHMKRWRWDISIFRHHTREEIEKAMDKYFTFAVENEGNSLRYVCNHKAQHGGGWQWPTS